ncbi:RNA polymerase sigma-70 factor (ECF subfamily) [Variovorax boronicumulans]|uniref:RNA polymerase sigma-70 factor (ECF subfamily) n=1 Tax=Variovorax boronicumulans TaxID=436515 RepID=A0AAW8CYA5_9BURK|nr:RNA polymerase sigma-70 factor [Variovorax boronicumulans]MDP9893468.1 RNA polymerase sigma-70 factor (ECF subfamily) [Variovorax boronicumulans]MDQ0053418.1 RNA polymerase sigma-70 factor (ECF subfamily) [Variovorax boronicumulans]MDQ0073221.1 RNA polymerase sigma-70 factor (ECF subfamily) [Variovorax boronicumulans]
MDDPTLTFDSHRRRLQGIAYRMLGSVAEAEEVVQDAWLRWHEADKASFDSAEAWLVTVVTRLSIDRLRAAKVQREHYIGAWMPEPTLTESPDTPEESLERADNISVAFLAVLERLAPEARAAFLMREVFEADYDEVALTLGKSEAACRQLVHRAKTQVQDARPRYQVSRETHQRLLRAFADAAARGSMQDLKALMTEEVELIGDGGGKVQSFSKVLTGNQRLAQLYYSLWRRMGPVVRMELVEINGEPGLLRFIDGELESAQTFEIEDDRIARIRVQRNPDKLARIAQRFAPK